MSITTRVASREDIPRLAELFDAYRQFYAQPANPELARRFIADRFNNGESTILVAETATDGVVGFCQLYPTFCSVAAAPIYSLYDLYVAPTSRQLGIGHRLLLAAEARARADGKVRMDLATAKTNLPAQALYESAGWVRDEIFHVYNRHLAD